LSPAGKDSVYAGVDASIRSQRAPELSAMVASPAQIERLLELSADGPDGVGALEARRRGIFCELGAEDVDRAGAHRPQAARPRFG
jgi:hypothetical protein